MTYLFLLFSLFIFPDQKSNEKVLSVEVTDIRDLNGRYLYVAIYDKHGFPKAEKFIYANKIKATAKTATINFKIPAGDYAVAVYHDINGNGKLDKTFIGLPKEPYAFSNNYVPVYRAPRFDECIVELRSNQKISIQLIH